MTQDTSAVSRVGETIAGKYLLMDLLGSGGMGAVYTAEHQFTHRHVAVKLMHPNIARSRVAAERFIREAQAPSSIGHPGIVEVLDGGYADDGSLYLVLELLRGETLSEAIERKMSRQELCAVMLQLLSALEAAHDAGFVHRDLKPDNIFLVEPEHEDEPPVVKLLDFGIAGLTEPDRENPNLTAAGAVLGTPLYMSPEQAKGQRVDERSDLWSVGAVMYRALAGKPPFRGDSFHALVVSIVTQEHFPLATVRPDLPVRLCDLVERALCKDVDQRWQSAEEMGDALHEVVARGRRPSPAAAEVQRAPRLVPERTMGEVEPAAGLPRWMLIAGATAVVSIAAAAFLGSRGSSAAANDAIGKLPDTQQDEALVVEDEYVDNDEEGVLDDDFEEEGAQDETESAAARSDTPEQATSPRGLSHAALGAHIEEHSGALQRCYQDVVTQALIDDPETAERLSRTRVDISLTVATSGRVRNARASGEMPDELRTCLQDEVRSWRFGPIGKESELSFPIVIQSDVVR